MSNLFEPTIADRQNLVSTVAKDQDTVDQHTGSSNAADPMTFAQWWRSDWGPGPLINLALPLMISTAFLSLTLFTDRTLLYWKSEQAASAAMGAGSLYWALTCLPMGLLAYVSTFVSQYVGAQRFERIPVIYRHAVRLAWLLVPVLLVAIALADVPFWIFGHSPELRQLEGTYLRTLLIGGLATLFYSAQSGLLTGLGRTKMVLAVDAIATFVNLVLDFVLIFGWGPFPELGVLGAAVATAISFWMKVPIAHWLMMRDTAIAQRVQPRQLAAAHRDLSPSQLNHDDHSQARTGKRIDIPWEPAILMRLIKYGAPAGLQMLSESSAFSVIMLQVGRLGGLPMAATTLALGLNVLAFVPMMGLGIGVGVLVGKHLLEKRVDLAQRTVTCALVLSAIYTAAFAVMLGFFPDFMCSLYAFGSPDRFEQMRPLLVPLLQIIAVYCVFDGFQIVFVGAIKGAGDTWFVLLGNAGLSASVVIGGLMCERIFGSGLLLWWYVIAVWVAVMALAFGLRYWQGKWKTMQVIEREPELA